MTDSQHYLERELLQKLRQDDEVFAFLDQGSLDGMWYWDLEHPEHEWMSPTFWRTLGFDPAERQHLAREWQDLIDPEDLEAAIHNFELHCADPSHPYDQVVRYRHRDGSTVWVRCRGLAVRNEEGKPVRMLGAHTDITSLMRTEEELRKRNEDLQTYAYAASHDLRSPLRGIGHLAEWIEADAEGPLGPKAEEHLQMLRERVQRMDQLLEDLLTHARIGAETYEDEEIRLEDLAFATIDLLGEKDVQLNVSGTEILTTARVPLELALRNLFSNAIHHHDREQVTLTVTTKPTAYGWEILVQDDGPGIPASRAEKVFELFRRLNSASTGSGMGLAIARRAMEQAGGAVELDPTPKGDRGARFRIRVARGTMKHAESA